MVRACQGHTLGLQSLLLLTPDVEPLASSDNGASECALRSAFKCGWLRNPSVFVHVLRDSPMGTVEARANYSGPFLLPLIEMELRFYIVSVHGHDGKH